MKMISPPPYCDSCVELGFSFASRKRACAHQLPRFRRNTHVTPSVNSIETQAGVLTLTMPENGRLLTMTTATGDTT